jgi:hypothetical protein
LRSTATFSKIDASRNSQKIIEEIIGVLLMNSDEKTIT